MNLPKKTTLLMAASAIAAVAVADPASAVSFTVRPAAQTTSTIAGATVIDFNDLATPANYSGDLNVLPTSSVINPSATQPIASSPFITTGNDRPRSAASYFADFSSGPGLGYFGLFWGSIDTYNTIDFITNGGTRSFTGSDIAASLGLFSPGDTTGSGNFNISRYVDFFAGPGEVIKGVRFTSSLAAFESDNHAYKAIPTPALLPGLVGFGIAALRKRKAKAAVEADA